MLTGTHALARTHAPAYEWGFSRGWKIRVVIWGEGSTGRRELGGAERECERRRRMLMGKQRGQLWVKGVKN